MKRSMPAKGQSSLFTKKPLDVSSELIGVRKIDDVRPGWKQDLVGLGRYRRIRKLSKEVRLSTDDRMFLELFEYDKNIDCVELWNRYYARMRIQMSPSLIKKILEEFLYFGLIKLDTV